MTLQSPGEITNITVSCFICRAFSRRKYREYRSNRVSGWANKTYRNNNRRNKTNRSWECRARIIWIDTINSWGRNTNNWWRSWRGVKSEEKHSNEDKTESPLVNGTTVENARDGTMRSTEETAVEFVSHGKDKSINSFSKEKKQ